MIYFAQTDASATAAPVATAPAADTASTTTATQEVPGGTPAAPARKPGLLEGPGFLVVMIVLMVAMFYISFRSQKKEKKRLAEAIEGIRKGDHVMTIGGIHGTVSGVKNDVFTLEISKGIEIDVQREAVRPATAEAKAEAASQETIGK